MGDSWTQARSTSVEVMIAAFSVLRCFKLFSITLTTLEDKQALAVTLMSTVWLYSIGVIFG